MDRATVRDDNISIKLVIYRVGHQPVAVTVTPLYALQLAGELSNSATRALYRSPPAPWLQDIPQDNSGDTFTTKLKNIIRRSIINKKISLRRFAG